jgi:hypothetical protein
MRCGVSSLPMAKSFVLSDFEYVETTILRTCGKENEYA